MIGAFKSGTHPTTTPCATSFRCQVELRNLTYDCNMIGAFKNSPLLIGGCWMVVDYSSWLARRAWFFLYVSIFITSAAMEGMSTSGRISAQSTSRSAVVSKTVCRKGT